MISHERHIGSEWEGLKGRIGGWYLNSPLRRASEIFFLGDLRSRFTENIDCLLNGNETVLDVGAGSGYFSLLIAEKLRTGKVIAVDLSYEMLESLRKRARQRSLSHKIDARIGNAYQLPIEDSTMDIATSNGVFHELSYPSKALEEMKRVLKRGGYAIVTDFRDTWIGKIIGAAHRGGDHGPFSAKELKSLFEDAGFANLEADAVRNWVVVLGQKK